MANLIKSKVEMESKYSCSYCGGDVYKCDSCDEYIFNNEVYCDASSSKHYCPECGEEMIKNG